MLNLKAEDKIKKRIILSPHPQKKRSLDRLKMNNFSNYNISI